jgi:uncharacterized protein YndB with AHSA1/START domain
MGQVYSVTERVLDAAPERTFEVLADYATTRPTLQPDNYTEYEVREGGQGAGTVVHWKVAYTEKRVRDCLFAVTEPSPGRLVETDTNSSLVITWTVTPAGEGRSKVVVEHTWNGAGGMAGFFERKFAPGGIQKINDQVLERLAAAVAKP